MSNLSLTYLGHTSILVATECTQLLFDPNLSRHVLCVKRLDDPYLNLDMLRSLSAIVISNAHHNRFDRTSFKYFPQSISIVVPKGLSSILSKFFHYPIKEVDVGESCQIGDITLTAEKALHRGFRLSGLRHTCALNYVISHENQKVLYTSDTRYEGSYFYELGKKYHFDAAILPIDHVTPSFLAGKRYLKPAQAAQALLDLNVQTLIPYAYGSFLLGKRDPQKSLKALQEQAKHLEMADRVKILAVGQKTLL